MRTAGTLLLTAAGLVLALALVVPTHISVLGTDISCGMPIFRAISSADDPFTAECVSSARWRVLEGGGLAFVGFGIGAALIAEDKQRERYQATQPRPPAGTAPAPGAVWDGFRWWTADGSAYFDATGWHSR